MSDGKGFRIPTPPPQMTTPHPMYNTCDKLVDLNSSYNGIVTTPLSCESAGCTQTICYRVTSGTICYNPIFSDEIEQTDYDYNGESITIFYSGSYGSITLRTCTHENMWCPIDGSGNCTMAGRAC